MIETTTTESMILCFSVSWTSSSSRLRVAKVSPFGSLATSAPWLGLGRPSGGPSRVSAAPPAARRRTWRRTALSMDSPLESNAGPSRPVKVPAASLTSKTGPSSEKQEAMGVLSPPSCSTSTVTTWTPGSTDCSVTQSTMLPSLFPRCSSEHAPRAMVSRHLAEPEKAVVGSAAGVMDARGSGSGSARASSAALEALAMRNFSC
mmetsp:Transcript_116528/g.340969  ORF Transcript_116528/g.340969 Transcript_116528/m.340969 type:complete len:204 (+) Transcript_116528:64-675(+)